MVATVGMEFTFKVFETVIAVTLVYEFSAIKVIYFMDL